MWSVRITVKQPPIAQNPDLSPGHHGTMKLATLIEPLTDRERDVLHRLVGGSTNREIADELGISVRTVESHLGNLYGKLGVRGRQEALLWAVQPGKAYV
jgi:DNA-binding CsgD family transcriptional regulator